MVCNHLIFLRCPKVINLLLFYVVVKLIQCLELYELAHCKLSCVFLSGDESESSRYQQACSSLAGDAIRNGSSDNVTVMLISIQ